MKIQCGHVFSTPCISMEDTKSKLTKSQRNGRESWPGKEEADEKFWGWRGEDSLTVSQGAMVCWGEVSVATGLRCVHIRDALQHLGGVCPVARLRFKFRASGSEVRMLPFSK